VFRDDILSDTRPRVEQLLRSTDLADPQATTELLWASAVTAREANDDASTLAARDRLAPLLDTVQDPYLHAVSELAVAWASAVVGEPDLALRQATTSLGELRELDEPLWTALALTTVGSIERVMRRVDVAGAHLTEVRDLAERLDNERLVAAATVQLGTLAATLGRLEQATPLLDDALRISEALHNPRNITLCLAGFAELALDGGDAARAARLAGAAQGLRDRAGLRPWPDPWRAEGEKIGQLREMLGMAEFDRAYSAGYRLNQRDALALAHNH
jgi:Tetratricopeptide repeat